MVNLPFCLCFSVSSRVSDVWDLLSCAVFNLPLLPHFFPGCVCVTCLCVYVLVRSEEDECNVSPWAWKTSATLILSNTINTTDADIVGTCLSFQRTDKKMFERLRRVIAIDAHIQVHVHLASTSINKCCEWRFFAISARYDDCETRIALWLLCQINIRALVLLLQTVATQFQRQRKNSKWSQKSRDNLLKNVRLT